MDILREAIVTSARVVYLPALVLGVAQMCEAATA
jgi:hypothetical protein